MWTLPCHWVAKHYWPLKSSRYLFWRQTVEVRHSWCSCPICSASVFRTVAWILLSIIISSSISSTNSIRILKYPVIPILPPVYSPRLLSSELLTHPLFSSENKPAPESPKPHLTLRHLLTCTSIHPFTGPNLLHLQPWRWGTIWDQI